MRLRHGGGDNFVVGMSLAEILLLLLFTFLVSQSSKPSPDGEINKKVLAEQVEWLRQDTAELHQRVRALQEDSTRKTAIIDALSRMTGRPITGPGDVLSVVTILKRGFPTCRNPNTLVDAIAQNHKLRLVILLDEPAIQERLTAIAVSLQKGDTIDAENVVEAFLKAVRSYGTRGRAECRFDYSLKYASPEDYYLAREKLERYLYPERMVRLAR